jgi:hypothetical protein
MNRRTLRLFTIAAFAILGVLLVLCVTAWLVRPAYADHPCYDPERQQLLPGLVGDDC